LTAEALRARGAHRFDPVRFCFIEALAKRSTAHQGEARRLLDGRLATALAAYAQRHARAVAEAGRCLDQLGPLGVRFPEAGDELKRLQADGDVRGLRQLAARLEARLEAQRQPTPLAGLVAHLSQQSSLALSGPAADAATPPRDAAAPTGPPTELKALRYFRSTWSRLSVDQQLARSMARQPANAGPLNSHLLVLRSLKLMREVSPDYLRRFVSYVDTLFWLDQATPDGAPVPAATGRGDSDRKRKRKPPRGKTG
jgi:hypothetical protein